MKIEVGDWVTWPGYITRNNPYGVHLISADDMARETPPGEWQKTTPIDVETAFELAGVPTPAALYHSHIDGWLAWDGSKVHLFHESAWTRGARLQAHIVGIVQNRTPLADAWEVMPLYVKTRLEEMAQ